MTQKLAPCRLAKTWLVSTARIPAVADPFFTSTLTTYLPAAINGRFHHHLQSERVQDILNTSVHVASLTPYCHATRQRLIRFAQVHMNDVKEQEAIGIEQGTFGNHHTNKTTHSLEIQHVFGVEASGGIHAKHWKAVRLTLTASGLRVKFEVHRDTPFTYLQHGEFQRCVG